MNKNTEYENDQQLVTVRLARPGYIPIAIPARLRITRFPLKVVAITRFGEFEVLPNRHEHVYSQGEFESKMSCEPPLDPDPYYADAEGLFDEDEELDEIIGEVILG